MSIGAYRWARHLSDGVLVGSPLRPRAQGIIAGSAFAATELRIMLTECPDQIVEDNPTASLVVHVDDISVSVSGESPLAIISQAQQADNRLVGLVQGRLGLPFSAEKATILATSRGLALRARRLIGAQAGTVQGTVRKLGYDYTLEGGALPGRAAVRRQRLIVAGQNIKRLARLRRGMEAKRIVVAGPLPRGLFGAEV